MADLASAISTAALYKRMPAYTAGDIGSLCRALKLPTPYSIKALIAALLSLPAAYRVFSGELNPATDTIFYTFVVQSDGCVSLKTHIHNASITAQNYLITVALTNIPHPDNKVWAFTTDGLVTAKIQFGSGDDDQQNDYFVPEFASYWPQIKNDGSLITKYVVQADPIAVAVDVVAGLLASVFVFFAVVTLRPAGGSKCSYAPNGEFQNCKPTGNP
jgi:hypothetical protein